MEIKPKGLGVSKHLCGGYRFCLQDTVCFVRNNSDKVDFEIQVGFSLMLSLALPFIFLRMQYALLGNELFAFVQPLDGFLDYCIK